MPQPSEKLFEEVMADAKTKADRIRRRGGRDAEAARKKVDRDAQAQIDRVLEAARTEAELKKSQILATVEIEAQRDRLTRLEDALSRVHREALERLRSLDSAAAHQACVRLAVEALRQMGEADVELALPSKVHGTDGQRVAAEAAEAASRELGHAVNVRLASSPAAIDDGVVVRTVGGRAEVVNSFDQRLRRLWTDVRLDVARRLFPDLVSGKEST